MVDIINFISLSIVCTFATSWLIRNKNMLPVRASSLVTLTVSSLFMLIDMKFGNRIAPVVLGGTFVGMSEASRLRFRSLAFASALFAITFYYVLPYNPGIGGGLGLAAFSSSVLIYSMKKFLLKKRSKVGI